MKTSVDPGQLAALEISWSRSSWFQKRLFYFEKKVPSVLIRLNKVSLFSVFIWKKSIEPYRLKRILTDGNGWPLPSNRHVLTSLLCGPPRFRSMIGTLAVPSSLQKKTLMYEPVVMIGHCHQTDVGSPYGHASF